MKSCKLGADPGSPYLFSLCANPLSWPLISQMSIHAQFILSTRGNTGYWSLNWPDLNRDFLQWGYESVLVPELVGPVGGMSDFASIWKDLVAKPCDSLVTEASMLLSFPLYKRQPPTMLRCIRNQTCKCLTVWPSTIWPFYRIQLAIKSLCNLRLCDYAPRILYVRGGSPTV